MIAMITLVGTGVLAGVYTTFSTIVMPALRQESARDAAATMTRVNRRAERGPFIVVFGGTAVVAVVLGISGLTRGSAIDMAIAGASLSGTAVTVLGNVPLNRRLDRGGAGEWGRYQRSWTKWNHLRALLSIAAVVVATQA